MNQTTKVTPYSSSNPHRDSVPVRYTNDPNAVYQWLCDHLPLEGSIIGFDVESVPTRAGRTKPSSNNPFSQAATVQLATCEACLVVQLARRSGKHSHACAPVLTAVLNDQQFIKAGCALDEDLMALYELWGGGRHLEAKSRLDLGFLTSRRRPRGCRYGLKSLSNQVLGVNLPKKKQITMSDWSAIPLSESQIIYSARDAWAGAAIANELANFDPDMFGLDALVERLEREEPPISQLVHRKRRRERAKRDLRKIFGTKRGTTEESKRLPPLLQDRVQTLREVIRLRVNPPHLVWDTDHLELDL